MMRTLVSLASHAAPGWVANLAYSRLNNPQVHKLRAHEQACTAQAEQSVLPFEGFDVRVYRWEGSGGQAERPILLVHGWEGQAGNFADLVDRLVGAGQTVVAFDAPAHGDSSRGTTSMAQFSKLVGTLIDRVQPKRIVSHSFGSVATTLALSQRPEHAVERWLFMTTPDRFEDRVRAVADAIGVSDGVVARLTERLAAEYGRPVGELNVSDLVPRVNVQRGLVLHDTADRVLRVEGARRVAGADSRLTLEEVTGTGHYRILRTASVLDRAVDFLCEPVIP